MRHGFLRQGGRDEILLDQQEDVVVFWARCIPLIRSWSPRVDAGSTYTAAEGEGYVANSRTLASKKQITANPKYNDDISSLQGGMKFLRIVLTQRSFIHYKGNRRLYLSVQWWGKV